MADKQTAVGKRQKIAQSNKMMFLWIAGMSAVVGICAVLAWFLIQQLVFHTKVASEADATVSTLTKNKVAVEKLRENVQLLDVNEDLKSVKSESDERALQVILDALPADDNNLALGSSLQQKLIGSVNGVKIDSLTVGDLSGTETVTSPVKGVEVIPFTLIMSSGDVNALKDVLRNFERSIRIVEIDNFILDRSDSQYKLSINAHAYYKPAVEVQLKDKVIKP